MIKNSTYIILLLALILVVGCKSKKQLVDSSVKADVEFIRTSPSLSGDLQGISGKMRLSANIAGKNVSSPGTFKIKRGDGVRLTIAPLGLFEAARVEFLPLSVQYMNRLESEYARLHYARIPLLNSLGIDYRLMESVLLNEVYIPANVSTEIFLATSAITREDGSLVLTFKNGELNYKYYIDETTGHLIKSIGEHAGGTSVTCLYKEFKPVTDRDFPSNIELTLNAANRSVVLSFSLSNMKELLNFEVTTPPASYKQLQSADLLNALGIK